MKTSSINWREVLKVVLTILTAIAGSLGVVSCMG
ncbi:MAG: smalltalk protein [Bacteroidaceae bacterium]|nr:smalltalk protein [Bacteroidaceae bacterium]